MRSQLVRGSTSMSRSVGNCRSVPCAVLFNSIGGRSRAASSYSLHVLLLGVDRNGRLS